MSREDRDTEKNLRIAELEAALARVETLADELDREAAGEVPGRRNAVASRLRAALEECGDYPAPCNHDPAHVRPDASEEES